MLLVFLALDLILMGWLGYRLLDRKIPDQILVDHEDSREVASILKRPFISFDDAITVSGKDSYKLHCRLLGVIPFKDVKVKNITAKEVYASGDAVGIYMQTKGVLIIDTGEILSESGEMEEPARDIVKPGDYIVAFDQNRIQCMPANQDNTTIEAEYTFYLGGNPVNDFKVIRNRHYANNIVISGLTHVGNNPDHITFDARVNITEQNNPFYLSMLRERDHDAHFCITPLDVYLFEEDENPKMKVSIADPESHTWIRMERVPAENMENGTLSADMSTDTHLATGQKWTAGNGKRKYFTTDLVTNTLAQNTEYTISRSRDRIYFYLDENLSTKDRTATVNISYTDNNTQTPRTRTIEIVQHGLLPVQWYYEGRLQGTIYVEAYEEYISHYDPLNEFEGDYIYDGLEWGCNGEYIGGPLNNEWTEGNKHGAAATRRIITQAGQSEMNLNEKPRSAAEYCYNKNKRNANGAVQGMSNSSGWFLPGISQLESILTSYYNTYTEFQNNFYWSSAAAKDRTGIWPAYIYPESTSYARATKALPDGGYAESDWDDIYTNDNGTTGKAPRINRPLRIRAAYVPPSGVTIQ